MAKFKEDFLLYLTNHVISHILVSSIRMFWYRNVMKFNIGDRSSIFQDFKVAGRRNIDIGDHCVVNNSCRFDNRFPIKIGNNVSITYGTSIFTKGHDVDDPLFRTKGAPVIIEDYVWIAAYAIILPGVTIKQGAVVLPGSVVAYDIAEYHIVGGNPAKFVRERERNLAYELEWNSWMPFWG